jgi:hypothetical protein
MSDVMVKSNDEKKFPPTVDGIPINELPITYGRLGGPSWAVNIAVSAYVEESPEYASFEDE